MSAKLCRCGKIVQGRCETCDKPCRVNRNTTGEGHGWDHRKASERYRVEHPLCERCVMLYGVEHAQPSRDMHHVHAIRDRPELRMQRSNWVAVCFDCHEAIEGDAMEGMKIKRWSDANYEAMLGVKTSGGG